LNSYLQFMRIGKLRWCLLYFIQMSSVAETFQIKKNNSIMGLPIDNPLRTRLWHTLPLLLNPTQGTRGLRCTSIRGPQNTQLMQNKMSRSQQHFINFQSCGPDSVLPSEGHQYAHVWTSYRSLVWSWGSQGDFIRSANASVDPQVLRIPCETIHMKRNKMKWNERNKNEWGLFRKQTWANI
jgi:hypothetical protein